MQIQEIINYLNFIAPPAYQEHYDNSGLLVGDNKQIVTNVLVSLDITEEIIDEAIQKNCNLIVAHHPIIFKGLKSLTGKNYVERTVIKAIKYDIALFAIHTNLDNAKHGVNYKIAEKLGLKNVKILAPKTQTLYKLSVYVPKENSASLLESLTASGAGKIGNYSECGFTVEGIGQFKPNNDANPSIGEQNKLEKVDENKIEVLVPLHLKDLVLASMFKAHPYEEVAYYLQTLENQNPDIGSGVTGDFEKEISTDDFLSLLKNTMKAPVIRHTEVLKPTVKKVALCGGSGSFLLPIAKKHKADVYLSADFKYHEFFDAERELFLCDIGHYESEQFTKDLIVDLLSEKFTNFATCLSEVSTNPLRYYY